LRWVGRDFPERSQLTYVGVIEEVYAREVAPMLTKHLPHEQPASSAEQRMLLCAARSSFKLKAMSRE
jgi:hypothetical protein